MLSLLWVAASNGFTVATIGALLPILTTAAIYAIAGVGLNMQYGEGGLLNFGFVAFMAIGGYTTVLLLPHQQGSTSTELTSGLPLYLAVVLGMLAAAAVGALFAIPALRLRADYLAIVMIALAEILRISLRSVPEVTGGVYGVSSFTSSLQNLRPGFLDEVGSAMRVQPSQLWIALVAWSCLLLVTVATALLMRTPWGYLLRAVRDDEYAVRSLGKRSTLVKLQVLMVGGAIGGLSGSLLSFQLSHVTPDIFQPQVTFFIFAIVILGGTSNPWGPLVGSIIFWVVLTQSGTLAAQYLGSGTVAAALRYILVGILIVALINFRPHGILGRRQDAILKFE